MRSSPSELVPCRLRLGPGIGWPSDIPYPSLTAKCEARTLVDIPDGKRGARKRVDVQRGEPGAAEANKQALPRRRKRQP